MATRNEAYVDTSALIALVDASDTYHDRFVQLFDDPPPLVSTPLVISEAHGWFLRRYGASKALQFLSLLEQLPALSTVAVGQSEHRAAALLLRKFLDQGLTLTDALGLHLMAVRRITACWSTDRHLSLTGVRLIIHE